MSIGPMYERVGYAGGGGGVGLQSSSEDAWLGVGLKSVGRSQEQENCKPLSRCAPEFLAPALP